MYSLRTFLIGCLAAGVVATEELTLEERGKEIWRSSEYENDESIREFEVKFEEDVIKDLLNRLNNRRELNPSLEGTMFHYGFNTKYMDTWMDHWANNYNFTEREAYLNKYPQFKTNIQGLDIHFVRATPEVTEECEVVPLLCLHGFPGSFVEFHETIPHLTAGCVNGVALEVIVPSVPGFGFSDAATRPGLGVTEIATVFINFMERLGYKKFYVQAGDWGSLIASDMATLYPDRILGFHTNFAVSLSPLSLAAWVAGTFDTSLVVEPALAERMYPLENILKDFIINLGYIFFQGSKPDTIGVATSDSPMGLFAYIMTVISYACGSDNINKEDGGLFDMFTMDQLIDNVMIYWISNSLATAARFDKETFTMRNLKAFVYAKPTPVPTWTTHTKDEVIYQSPTLLKFKFPNLLNSTVYSKYSHFFAAEQPEVFAESVFEAMAAFKQWHSSNDLSKNEL